MRKISVLILFTLFLTVFTIGCEDSKDDEIKKSFDRSLVLINWSDNIIIPAYKDFQNSLSKLESSTAKFKNNVSQENLDHIRTDWLEAYKIWQHVEMFNIGKAEEIFLTSKMNVYPADVDRIKSNIESMQYDLNHPNNNVAQGFPTLDYLLYGGISDGSKVIDRYLSTEGNRYLSYLEAIVNQMIANTKIVVDNWGSYRNEFVQSTENTATSSINMLTNDFIFYYEKGLRANKIGIPGGVFSPAPIPENVEGYYHGNISKILALEALDAVYSFFVGIAYDNSTTKESFKSILQTLEANKEEKNLGELIKSKLLDAKNKIQNLDTNFSNQIKSNNTEFLQAYDAIQEVVVLMKVDMLQSLNISVDYIDADGD